MGVRKSSENLLAVKKSAGLGEKLPAVAIMWLIAYAYDPNLRYILFVLDLFWSLCNQGIYCLELAIFFMVREHIERKMIQKPIEVKTSNIEHIAKFTIIMLKYANAYEVKMK